MTSKTRKPKTATDASSHSISDISSQVSGASAEAKQKLVNASKMKKGKPDTFN